MLCGTRSNLSFFSFHEKLELPSPPPESKMKEKSIFRAFSPLRIRLRVVVRYREQKKQSMPKFNFKV